MKLKNALLAVAGIFLFFIISFEIGFAVRENFFTSKVFLDDFSHDKIRILLLGDSVLGNIHHKSSLAGFIREKLERERKKVYVFKHINMPKTSDADSLIETEIKRFQPHVALILTGKNDSNSGLTFFRPWMLKIKFLRFLDMAIAHYTNRFKNFATLFYFEDVQEAAILRASSKCAEAIPIYESIVSKFDFEVIYSNLHDCYMKTRNYRRGIQFFGQVINSSKHVEQLKDFILINEVAESGKFTGVDFLERFSRKVKERTFVKSNLWFYKAAGNVKLFREEFENMPEESSDKINVRTAHYLKNLIQLLLDLKAKPVLLQYPLDHLAPLKNALQLTDEIEYIEIRKLLINAPDEVLVSGWEDDMEHLSFVGANYISDKIVRKLLTMTAYGTVHSQKNQ